MVSISSDSCTNEFVLSHLFMPAKLEMDDDYQNEIRCVGMLGQYLKVESDTKLIGNLSSIISTFYNDLVNPLTDSDLVQRFKESDTVVVYLRYQNCLLLFKSDATSSDTMKIYVIQVYPHDLMEWNSSVTKMVLPVPNTVVKVKRSHVTSIDFTVLLVKLRNMTAIHPTCIPSLGNREEDRVVAIPDLIVGLLIPALDVVQLDNSKISFYKSIRPEVMVNSKGHIWKRSALWVGTKHLVHLLHRLEFGRDFEYKIFIIGFKSFALSKSSPHACLPDMITKVAVTADKLKRSYPSENTELSILKCQQTCQGVSDRLSSIWSSTCKNEQDSLNIDKDIKELKSLLDTLPIEHKFKKVKQQFNILQQNEPNPSSIDEPIADTTLPIQWIHNNTTTTINFILNTLTSNNWIESGLTLNNIELLVNQLWLDKQSIGINTSPTFKSILIKYIQIAKTRYNGNPTMTSRLVLISYTLVAILDLIASINGTPAQQQYYQSVPPYVNIGPLKYITLQYKWEHVLLDSIESYFISRHVDQATLNNSIFGLSSDGLPYRWASRWLEYEFNTIKRNGIQEAERKRNSVESRKREIDHQISRLKKKLRDDDDELSYGQIKKLKKQIDDLKSEKMSIFEYPLPRDEIYAQIVVFELHIPQFLGDVRDSFDILGRFLSSTNQTSYDIKDCWKDNSMFMVNLHSSTQRLSSCQELTVYDHDSDSFVVQAKRQVSLYAISSTYVVDHLSSWTKILPSCTYQIPGGTSLQAIVQAWEGTQENGILATQIDTPVGMEVDSFINYGMVRCGNNLQLHNIFRFLELNQDIEKVSSYCLLHQELFQVRPQINQSRYQHWSEDLDDINIINSLCMVIQRLLKEGRKNWDGLNGLVFHIQLLTTKINLSTYHHPGMVHETLDICRDLSIEWASTLNDLRIDALKANKEKEAELYRYKCVMASICTLLTFDIQDRLEISQDHAYKFICASSLIKDHTSFSQAGGRVPGISIESINHFIQLMTKVDHIKYNNINLIHQLLQDDQNPLNEFASKCSSNSSVFTEWSRQPNSQFWRCQRDDNAIIHVNPFDGSLLVNGLSIKRVPLSIEGSSLYKRIFSTSIFDVDLISHNRWRISKDYQKRYYEFFLIKNQVGIMEKDENGDSWLLIDNGLFDELPPMFRNNFSHWINCMTFDIQFRPINYQHFDQYKIIENYFIGNLETGLIVNRSNQPLMNHKSYQINQNIRKIFSIETFNRIHIFKGDENYIVHLFGYNLEFIVDNDKIESFQYTGYTICPSQYIGTFIGLSNLIVIENKNSKTKKVIIPNVYWDFKDEQNGIHRVAGRINNLDSKLPYLMYIVNQDLLLMEPMDRSSNLVLVYLHIVTGHPFIDPFTQMAGLEMGLKIMERFINNIPLTNEETSILIDKVLPLCPQRCFSPTNRRDTLFQMVQYSTGYYGNMDIIPFFIKSYVDRVNELSFIHGSQEKPNLPDIHPLTTKSFWLNNALVNPQLANLFKFPDRVVNSVVGTLYHSPTNSMDAISRTAHLFHNVDLSRSSFDVKSLINGVSSFCLKSCIVNDELSEGSNWASLYQMAYNVNHGTMSLLYVKYAMACMVKKFQIESKFCDHIISLAMSPPGSLPQLPAVTSYTRPNEFFNSDEIRGGLRSQFSRPLHMPEKDYKLVKLKFEITNIFNTINSSTSFSTYNHQNYPNNNRVYIQSQYIKSDEWLRVLYQQWIDNVMLNRWMDKINQIIRNNCTQHSIFNNYNKWNIFRVRPYIKKEYYWRDPFKSLFKDDIDHLEERVKLLWEQGYDQEIEKMFEFKLKNNYLKGTPKHLELFFSSVAQEGSKLEQLFYQDLKDSMSSLINQINIPTHVIGIDINQFLYSLLQSVNKFIDSTWTNIFNHIQENESTIQLIFKYGGSNPKPVPIMIYQEFIDDNHGFNNIDSLIASNILMKTYRQKINRCMIKKENDLEKEISHKRSTRNWKPFEERAWNLYELEQNIWIRDIQVEVATKQLTSSTNICTQLQMGEGKTSVILPIMILSQSKKSVVRVTVLPSLFETSIKDLQKRLGSLVLVNPLYIYPFKRDMGSNINSSTLSLIQKNLEECKKRDGFILCTPEHRLSFRLFWQLHFETVPRLGDILKWYQLNVFDIMDECDDLLSHKYQLIYPCGSKIPLDGTHLRWETIQDSLFIIRENDRLVGDDNKKIEFKHRGSGQFPYIVVYDQAEGDVLIGRLVDQLVEGLKVYTTPEKLESIKQLANKDDDTKRDQHVENLEILKNVTSDQDLINQIMIIRGMVSYQTFIHAFSKIWSKDYGTRATVRDQSKQNTLLAVPYRAKDTPCDRAEYGHADYCLILTHLSYYYQGLTYQQFENCLDHMLKCHPSTSSKIYKSWVDFDGTIHSDYADIKCLVRNDKLLLEKIHTLFKYNMKTINYWLNALVFNQEPKQYQYKLSANPWDMVEKPPGKEYISCGFSGTNDTKCLYPLEIKQQDIDKLKYTNIQTIDYILGQSPMYNEVIRLQQDDDIINRITNHETNFTVLIDAGALMVGNSNQEVAKKWLDSSSREKIDGVVYFDQNNNLVGMNRQGRKYLFDQSPFIDKMDRVLVYLDDYHTRGVDIKLPQKTHAALTIGINLTKEKLTQAAMRMRKLGYGQTVTMVVAPQLEVKDDINSILHWTISNVVEYITKSFTMWGSQGLDFTRTSTALRVLDLSPQLFEELSKIEEIHSLEEMYQGLYHKENIGQIIKKQSQCVSTKIGELFNANIKNDRVYQLLDRVSGIHKEMVQHINNLVPNAQVYSSLLEEEEREFEMEQEREEERQLPGRATPLAPQFDENLFKLVLGTLQIDKISCIYPISKMYNNTTLDGEIETGSFGNQIYVTSEFIKTVSIFKGDMLNDFYRFPNYILVVWTPPQPLIVYLSMDEANHLLPFIRLQKVEELQASLHQTIPMTSSSQQDFFLESSTPLPPNSNLQLLETLFVQIKIINGSTFFGDHLEQLYQFLGVVKSANKSTLSKLIQHDIVDGQGFVLIKKVSVLKSVLSSEEMKQMEIVLDEIQSIIDSCKFKKNPVHLIRKILDINRTQSLTFSEVNDILSK